MKKCEEILTEQKNILVATAEYLLENETMDGEDFKWLCEHDGQAPPKKAKPADEDSGVYVEFSKEYQQTQELRDTAPAEPPDNPPNTVNPGEKDTGNE